MLDRFEENPYNPPSVKEAVAVSGEEIYAALLDLDLLVQVSQEVVFRSEILRVMKDAVVEMILASGTVSVAGFRDRFNTSRKYALAFLEHLDSIGLTVREGEGRRLK